MDIYLAGLYGRKWLMDDYIIRAAAAGGDNMDLYLAGQWPWKKDGIYDNILYKGNDKKFIDVAILESFYYADEWTESVIPHCQRFLLDSGAFTFFSSGKRVDWEEYLRAYIAFINKNNVQRFFELDIDSLIGYPKVLEFRKTLEAGTGKQCIPVWHKSRGKDEFLKMCRDYNYVAIGGIVSKEITPPEYRFFPWFINEAHKRGAKIHGLGFTNLEGLKKYKFDSVDSTSWTTGNRFGSIYTFDGKTIVKTNKPPGTRLKDPKAAAVRNFNEWVKFQKYARYNL